MSRSDSNDNAPSSVLRPTWDKSRWRCFKCTKGRSASTMAVAVSGGAKYGPRASSCRLKQRSGSRSRSRAVTVPYWRKSSEWRCQGSIVCWPCCHYDHNAESELHPPQRGPAVVLRLVLGSPSFSSCKRMTAENHGDSTLDSKKATAAKC